VLEGAGTLELLAELAIGALGFSGIVAAIGQRGSEGWGPSYRRRFFSMVFTGALVIVLALLPFPLHYAGLQAPSLWAWSSGAGGLLILATGAAVVRASPASGVREMARDPDINNAVLGFGLLAIYGSPVLLFLNAAGVVFDQTFAPYLVAVLMNFAVTLLTFIRLLQTVVRGGKPAV
jgi:hypothetical protein